MTKRLLYITFIAMSNSPETGSSVRPKKMLNAFQNLDVDIILLSGWNNHVSERKKRVLEIEKYLQSHMIDMCYIEPPSGPMFCREDIKLIKMIHKKGIPLALFYRDCYWRFPEYYVDVKTSYKDRLKLFVIKQMQKRQWKVFADNCDILYFPSKTMADLFDCKNKEILPPGSFLAEDITDKGLHDPLTFIFVGGAAENHGTFLTLNAFRKVYESGANVKLIYICPEKQWKALGLDYKDDWLEVKHLSGDDQLKEQYARSDIALLTAPRTFYRDFAVPIKIYEYMSYLKPVLVTNCTETARIINDYKLGWVVDDTEESVVNKLKDLLDRPDQITEVKKNIEFARDDNLWVVRAKKVIEDLERVKK